MGGVNFFFFLNGGARYQNFGVEADKGGSHSQASS